MILYYCCTRTNNDCPNKEKCMRYLNAESAPHATLFKYACIEENNYLLFMPKEDTTEMAVVGNDDEENKGDTKQEQDDGQKRY